MDKRKSEVRHNNESDSTVNIFLLKIDTSINLGGHSICKRVHGR
jgi:hypothetical protein